MENKQSPAAELHPGQITYTVDSFEDGIVFGQHKLEEGQDPRDYYALRVQEDSDLIRLRSRYSLHQDNPLHELEKHLMRLSSQGILRSSAIYFGVTTDPFLPFQGKFDATMKFLNLFQKYTPGLLVVQTRSPLVVLAMPVFKKLGSHAAITIGIETPVEAAAQRYTPYLPRTEERLKAANALRRFGIEVTLQVSPVLPYGDWKKDAASFAQTLADHGDYIHIRALTDGSEKIERKVRGTTIAKKLAEDRQFFYLRPDTAKPLINAVYKIKPEALKAPERAQLKTKQMRMFAA
jgi:DNA repair photolyase